MKNKWLKIEIYLVAALIVTPKNAYFPSIFFAHSVETRVAFRVPNLKKSSSEFHLMRKVELKKIFAHNSDPVNCLLDLQNILAI